MIDREAVLQHYRRGKNYAEIAETMQCSEKQVGRIVREHATPMCREANKYAKNGEEELFWMIMLSCNLHPVQVANYAGVSRQTIYDVINEMKGRYIDGYY